ncbi:MAG: Rne/Rng family ribonuclease [Egibacteraceae bacterium]
MVRRRQRRRSPARVAEAAAATADEAANVSMDTGGHPATDAELAETPKMSRTRRRSRGSRSASAVRGSGRTPPTTQAAAEPAEAVDDPSKGSGEAVPNTAAQVDKPAPTRLQARTRRPAGRTAGRGTRGRTSRRVLGGVSEETRRAITEGPPRRMLVSVGQERTQIAVLEERVLVEHYVTHRQDTSYVGNIYVGRVQNVLPGMEAAFVDVGKGRNGVLYAGEVNYDDADLDGELPRIEQTLKPGQTALVQVTKDPMGTKGARLTQHLSIAGRYCVLAPGDGMLGISRKLTDDERERLRKILKAIKPQEYGLIVRTAAEGATAEQLEADVARLVRIWEQVNQRATEAKPLEPVYEEPDLVIRVIRDVFGPEFIELVVDSEELGAQVRTYLADVSPELVDRVSVYTGEQNILDAYEVTNQIRRALEKKVWLKSGGYLIVEKTEAMWIIDVNTGKFVGEYNLEETVLKNNIEAAVEITRQLRLRDMGGIIVIDFVDMLLPANREEVLKRFKRELARDKTKSRVMEISKVGLVQMTRKNVSQGLQESFMARCDECEGRGSKMVTDILS